MSCRSAARSGGSGRFAAAFGPVSRQRLRIFLVKLAAMILFAAMFAVFRGRSPLGMLAVFCGWQALLSAVTALLQGRRLNAGRHSAWDEMAAFVGISALARFARLFVG